MLIRLYDSVQVINGKHVGKFGKVVGYVPNDDTKAVVFIYHNGVTIWPHIDTRDLIVCNPPHRSNY